VPDSLSATTTTTTTNAPLGGSIAFFPPFLTTTPLPLLLQNPASAGNKKGVLLYARKTPRMETGTP